MRAVPAPARRGRCRSTFVARRAEEGRLRLCRCSCTSSVVHFWKKGEKTREPAPRVPGARVRRAPRLACCCRHTTCGRSWCSSTASMRRQVEGADRVHHLVLVPMNIQVIVTSRPEGEALALPRRVGVVNLAKLTDEQAQRRERATRRWPFFGNAGKFATIATQDRSGRRAFPTKPSARRWSLQRAHPGARGGKTPARRAAATLARQDAARPADCRGRAALKLLGGSTAGSTAGRAGVGGQKLASTVGALDHDATRMSGGSVKPLVDAAGDDKVLATTVRGGYLRTAPGGCSGDTSACGSRSWRCATSCSDGAVGHDVTCGDSSAGGEGGGQRGEQGRGPG